MKPPPPPPPTQQQEDDDEDEQSMPKFSGSPDTRRSNNNTKKNKTWIFSMALTFFVIIFAFSIFFNPLIILSSTPLYPDPQQTQHQTITLPILRSNTSSLFELKLTEFLTYPCDGQFFMTWISPAPLFGSRQILAVETLFKSHPRGCLTILSDTMDSHAGRRILGPISDVGFMILPITPDLRSLFMGTPALKWYESVERGEVDLGQIPFAQNLSNLLRLAVLYKFGGVYLDADVVVLRSFSGLRNSIGAQTIHKHTKVWSRLNNAVLIFEKKHPLVMRFMEEFVAGFDGTKWGHNGPYLVSRVVERVEEEGGAAARGFTVLSPMAFYPVKWSMISGLFQRPNNQAQMSWAERTVAQLSEESYAVHLWNKESSGLRIEEGSVIGRLFSDHCIICRDIFTP